MPPKKKTKEPVQTKLSFKPISKTTTPSPTTLFTTQTAAPLRSHMSILNQTESHISHSTAPKISPSGVSRPQILPSKSSFTNTSSASLPERKEKQTSQIGGNNSSNGVNGTIRNINNNDAFSTRELASSISSSESAFRSTTVNGTTYDYIPECSTPKSNASHEASISSTNASFSIPASIALAIEEPHDDHIGSNTKPVELGSDSDDDLVSAPKQTSRYDQKPSRYLSQPTPQRQSSSSSLDMPGSLPLTSQTLSLLEQMATPRGSRPLARTVEVMGSRGSSMLGRTASRPIMVPSSLTVSDEGFTSGSSLDSRMRFTFGSQEPEMTPPLSQGSLNGGSQHSQKALLSSSGSTKVQNYSQKRPGDSSIYSDVNVKKRTLPVTVTGYNPVSKVQPGSGKVTMASLARTNSRSRSSSPAPKTLMSSVQQSYGKNMTKDGMLLSDEQQHVLDQVINYHRNVFFTGSAGTGKSVLLRELIFQLRKKYSAMRSSREYWESTNDAVAVTASTGIAACNIGGCTLHSFAGVGLGKDGLPVLQAKVRKNATTIRRWQDTKVLIVDEVSMIDAEFMDKLEALARFIRKNDSPWGGMQVVLTGDFFQLPPVSQGGNVRFCFEGDSWARSISETIQLRQVFRQKDQTFADMLNEMRLGKMAPATEACFRTLHRELKTNDGLRPTELFPMRNQVEEANRRMLHNLPGKSYVFHAKDRGPMKEKMEQNCLAPTVLELKLNAQVMLLRNQGGGSGGLVNGSLGILVGFVARPADNENQVGSGGERKGGLNLPGEELPLVRFTLEGGVTREMVVGREEWKIELPNGDLQGARVQIPLGLAWSLSIHKSQGQTLPKVRVDLGKVFEKGQAYVALSRATTLEGLQVINFDPRKVMVHPKVTAFYDGLRVYDKPRIG